MFLFIICNIITVLYDYKLHSPLLQAMGILHSIYIFNIDDIHQKVDLESVIYIVMQ